MMGTSDGTEYDFDEPVADGPFRPDATVEEPVQPVRAGSSPTRPAPPSSRHRNYAMDKDDRWRCMACHSSYFERAEHGWICSSCGDGHPARRTSRSSTTPRRTFAKTCGRTTDLAHHRQTRTATTTSSSPLKSYRLPLAPPAQPQEPEPAPSQPSQPHEPPTLPPTVQQHHHQEENQLTNLH